MDPADFFVVQFDRRQLLGMTVAGLGIGALGVLALVYLSELARAVEEPALFIGATALVCVLFFGGWGVVAARHLFYFGPALVIDAKGIVDMASLARLGRIPWSDIAGFGSGRLTGNQVLLIRMHDAAPVVRGAWPWMRLVHWASLRRYGSPVVVPVNLLRASLKDLLATCKRFHAAAKERGRQSAADSTSKD